jgi:hypothetical protein
MRISFYIILSLLFSISELSGQCTDNGNQWAKSWVSCQTSPSPNPLRGTTHWILYEFIQNHYLDTTYIWNANRNGESLTGLKDVIIDYSEDGSNWFELGAFTFPQAPESESYQGFAGPLFNSASVKKVLITVLTTHGGGSCASLGEIQFQIDTSKCHGIMDPCGICNGPGEAMWYIDADGDGKGSLNSTLMSCEQPFGYVDNDDDECDSGELGWNDISLLFQNSCNGCHIAASAGGLSLATYASFAMGGNICGPEIKSGDNLVGVITISQYNGCGTPISIPPMNQRTGSPLSQSELDKIQRWIDGGAPEFCDDFCIENDSITTHFTTGMVAYMQANNQIMSTSQIDSGTIITFEAGQELLFENGFTVLNGAQFLAQIGGCEE